MSPAIGWHFQDAAVYCIYGPETYSEAFDKELTEEEFAKIANKDLPYVHARKPPEGGLVSRCRLPWSGKGGLSPTR